MIAAYSVVLGVSILMRERTDGLMRYLVTAAPIVPFSALPLILGRMLSRVDERERTLVYRALTFAFFATAIVTFGYGFLEIAGAPRLSMFWVWPAMATFWIIGRWVAPRMP